MAILGISAHKTTIYHTQSIGLLNNSWLADPVQTAAMQGVMSGSDPANAVLQAIESGTGYNLRQYYPYATRRFKKRDCNWSISTVNSTGSVEFGLNRERLLIIIPELQDKEFRIVHDVDYFSYSGSKTFEDIALKYNWNDFSEPLPDGTNIVITGAESPNTFLDYDGDLGNSWVVGTETSKGVPVLILDPNVDESIIQSEYYLLAKDNFKPDLSGGLVYWLSSKGFESNGKQNETVIRYTQAAFDLLNLTGTEPREVNRLTDWVRDNETKVSVNFDDLPDDENDGRDVEKIPLSEPREEVTVFYQQLTNTIQVGNTYEYEVTYWEETGVINYDSVHYVWATKTDESHVGVSQYFSTTNNSSLKSIGSKKDKWFKFYPYLPIKEHEQDVLDFSQAKRYLNALKEHSKDVPDNEIEESRKSNRDGLRAEQVNKKNTKRDVSRVLTNKNRYTRRMRIKGNQLGIEQSDERHLIQMGRFLNTDYKETASTLATNEDYSKIYQASLLPAVTLGSNYDEVNDYWFRFINNLYKKVGLNSYLNFVKEVNNLPDNCTFKDVLSLPRTELSYGIEERGQFGGFISFAFMQKFKITGSIRTAKRKGKLKEVKLGIHRKLKNLTGEDLKKALLEPSKELVVNEYYTSPVSGKQYNIGGGSLYGDDSINEHQNHAKPIYQDSDKSNLMFEEYGFTFFCKDLGNNELEVIAIAGLLGGITRSGYVTYHHGSVHLDGVAVMSRACHELRMFWSRNRKRYIEKVLSEKIDVKTVFTAGSKRRKLETNIQSFFIVPLDYKTVSRMSGTSIMRLANRAVLTHTWVKIQQRRIRGWVKIAIQIIGAIITVVGAIYGDGGSTGMSLMAMAQALATAIAVQLVVKYTVQLLIRIFGFKGFIGILIAIIVIVVAAVLGGWGNISSLPYGSQLASAQVASSAGQVAQQSVSQSILNNLKSFVDNMIKQTLGDLSNMTGKELLQNTANLVSKMADAGQGYLAQENQKIANQLKQATEEYEKHMGELQDLKELNQERTAPYDVKAVMESLTNKAKLIDPDTYLTMTLLSDNVMASEEFISQFIQTKLNLEPSSFDPVGSLDFSLTMKD